MVAGHKMNTSNIANSTSDASAGTDDFSLQHPLRVRWAEVDLQAVVFNGHYLTYFDVGISEYWRACKIEYPDGFIKRYQCDFFVVKATIEYHASARYDDELLVCARALKLGRTSMRFAMQIHRDNSGSQPSPEHLISGELIYVCVDPVTRQPKPIPQDLRDVIKLYEKILPEE
jgi:acyl-CoA thioester hydrolase